jgi:hypothetical protein
MTHHLILHKYAHNGIGGDELADIINIIYMLELDKGSDIWAGFHFVHSLAHIYDDIYMRPYGSSKFDEDMDYLEKIKRDMFEPNIRQFDCLRKIMNDHRSDVLVKTGEEFNQPYQLKPESIADKLRQYQIEWFSPEIYPYFKDQMKGYPYQKIGETTKTMHEDEV